MDQPTIVPTPIIPTPETDARALLGLLSDALDSLGTLLVAGEQLTAQGARTIVPLLDLIGLNLRRATESLRE